MRSILWQLERYAGQPRRRFINADKFGGKGNPRDLYEEMPEWADILYPLELHMIYEQVLEGRYGGNLDPEGITDSMLASFVGGRLGAQEERKYEQVFMSAATPQVRRLALLRGLMATYTSPGDDAAKSELDMLPKRLTRTFKRALSIPGHVGRIEVMDQILIDHSRSSTEEIILGRIGYLILWAEAKKRAART